MGFTENMSSGKVRHRTDLSLKDFELFNRVRGRRTVAEFMQHLLKLEMERREKYVDPPVVRTSTPVEEPTRQEVDLDLTISPICRTSDAEDLTIDVTSMSLPVHGEGHHGDAQLVSMKNGTLLRTAVDCHDWFVLTSMHTGMSCPSRVRTAIGRGRSSMIQRATMILRSMMYKCGATVKTMCLGVSLVILKLNEQVHPLKCKSNAWELKISYGGHAVQVALHTLGCTVCSPGVAFYC